VILISRYYPQAACPRKRGKRGHGTALDVGALQGQYVRAGEGAALPLAGDRGPVGGLASSSPPSARQRMVSSDFVPLMEGFQAKAWFSSATVGSPGAALTSRGR